MNRFLKSAVVILLLLSLCVGAFGCAQDTEQTTSPSDEPSDLVSENVTVPDDGNAGENDEEEFITITDMVGREVDVKKNVERIVDLGNLDGIRTYYQLNVMDKLVGVTDNSVSGWADTSWFVPLARMLPDLLKDYPTVGSGNEPNVQSIMELEPDVIFMATRGADLADTIQAQTGVPVVCIAGLVEKDQMFDMIKIVSQVVGAEERGEELIGYCLDKLQMITNVTDNIPDEEKLRAFHWHVPMEGWSSTHAHYAPIDMAGGLNVADEAEADTYQVTVEQIAAWNPDIIFPQGIHQYQGIEGDDAQEAEGWYTLRRIFADPILQHTTAVQEGKVYHVIGTQGGYDSTTTIIETIYMAKLMYPELFPDLDVREECNNLFIEFYGDQADGVFDDLTAFIHLHTWD